MVASPNSKDGSHTARVLRAHGAHDGTRAVLLRRRVERAVARDKRDRVRTDVACQQLIPIALIRRHQLPPLHRIAQRLAIDDHVDHIARRQQPHIIDSSDYADLVTIEQTSA